MYLFDTLYLSHTLYLIAQIICDINSLCSFFIYFLLGKVLSYFGLIAAHRSYDKLEQNDLA